MKKLFLFFVATFFPIVICADDVVEVGDICYNLVVKSKIAEVTSKPTGKYYWDVNIPASIVYGGETYSVTSIGYGAFRDCNELNRVTIPNSVTNIGRSAFYGCSRLNTLNIPNSVTTIDESAFFGCSSMTSFTIPNSVTSVGPYAFYGCSSLTSIVIPNSLNIINNYMFAGCKALKSVIIPNSINSIGYASFSGCVSLASIEIPSNVKSIGDFAFQNCSSLTFVNIPNNVGGIGTGAFQNCNLTLVKIGSGIKEIDSEAFANNKELKDVYCLAENVPETRDFWGNKVTDIFTGSHIEDVVLHVPATSINLYKAVEPWKSFKIIVGVELETPKCMLPTISYSRGKLKFDCGTEGAEYVYEISDSDIMKGFASEVQLSVTYNISVYATKVGYDNSDIATATLCWIDVDPKTDGIVNNLLENRALPVLIKSNGGSIDVIGVDYGTQVNVYNTSGNQLGSAVSQNGTATVHTFLQPGSVAIIKIGQKSLKVVIR